MHKNENFIRGREKSDRGREVGLEGEGSGGRGGGKRGERGREVGGKGEGSRDWVPPCPPPQQAFSKPCLVNLISKDTHIAFSISFARLPISTSVLKALPGKLDIKLEDLKVLRRSPGLLDNVKIGKGQHTLI